MYRSEYAVLKSLRDRTAKFHRAALHVHSPASFDWARLRGDSKLNDTRRFDGEAGLKEFVTEIKQHFDLVAITDHMKCGFGTRVSKYTASDSEVSVLPGMEVSLVPEAALGYQRIHLLVILPQGSDDAQFERLFFGTGIPADDARTGKEVVQGVSLQEWVKRVHDETGLCIAAHVDDKNGVRYLFRQTSRETLKLFSDDDRTKIERENDVPENLKRYLLESKLDAVEVARSSDARHYRWESGLDGKTRWLPTVLHSDVHCVEDLGRADKVTHIKMTSPGLRDLKSAFKFPDTRIRFPDNLPKTPEPLLQGLEIIGDSTSFFDKLTIAPAENLNCVIGVRGSGKSTVVEALRYVFGYNRSLKELGDLESSIRELQRTNLRGCMLRAYYRTREGNEHVLQATYDDLQEYATKVYSSEGDHLEVADVEESDEYPLRLYGWSEIELLGRSPSKQRDLLDRLIPGLKSVLRKRDDLKTQLKVNRQKLKKVIEELRAAYAAGDHGVRRYAACKKDFDKQNTPDVQKLFVKLDQAKEKRQLLETLKTNARNLRQSYAPSARDSLIDVLDLSPDDYTPDTIGVTDISVRDGVDTLLADSSKELRDWWQSTEISALNVIGVEQDVTSLLKQALDRLQIFEDQVEDHIRVIQAEEETISNQLREQISTDATMQKIADLRANAEKRLNKATSLRNEYIKARKNLSAAIVDRKRITDQIVSTQNEIAGIRAKHVREVQNKLSRFLPRDEINMAIDFIPGGDTDEFEKMVPPFLKGVSRYKARQLHRVVANYFTPIEFARMLGNGELDDLIEKSLTVDGENVAFTAEDVEIIRNNTYPFSQDDHADVSILFDDGARLEGILDLQETNWDDRETILLNDHPVNEVSPGQRSSIMLPLIALAQSTPLVIDQPEDNLDKRLIGRVLVNILTELKEKRQIIVCTHDPNILVGGDAEQVVVLEAISDRRGKVASHGSIDNSDIVSTVLDLLEGGEEAFENRRRRYAGE